jgi:hypothetical protein
MGPLMARRSQEFARKFELQKNSCPGFITKATEEEVLEYIRRLEWMTEELEGRLYESGYSANS